mmetsp:Transcript_12655/g.38155  ORF Transcript_12655/g.38155 Transcript_12655/m.38155 type:complete len:886 (-) Transcript_12655:954-3611(-)
MAQQEDRRVGCYVVGKHLGKGSFADVWLAHHAVTGAAVAIKEINTGSLNAKLKQSLAGEVSIMQRVVHRNIVRLHETLEEGNKMYLMLELCSGGDLTQFIKERGGRVPEAVAHSLMRQLAAGLKEMRALNLVHRDLKPQNLLLSDTGPEPILKIADFGFARDLQPQGLAETLCGSPLYMAPEILQHRKYDAKADLWSVGTILFELLVGRAPFGGNNYVTLLRNIESRTPRIPSELHLSSACRRLLAGLLKRNPVERMSFEEFFQHAWLAGDCPPPCSEGAPPPVSPGRHGLLCGASSQSESGNSGSDMLPFVVAGGGGGSGSGEGPLPAGNGGGGAGGKPQPKPLLMSSTRLDALMGPLTPSGEFNSRLIDSRGVGSSYSGGVRNGATSGRGDGGDDLDSDYVIVHPSAGLGTAAPGRQQPPSPGSLAALGRRGFAAMWHPLAAQLGASPPLGRSRPPPAPHPSSQARSGGAQAPSTPPGASQRPPVTRSVSARPRAEGAAAAAAAAASSRAGASPAGPARRAAPQRSLSAGVAGVLHERGALGAMGASMMGSVMTGTPLESLVPGSPAEELEQVANAFEAVAATATHGGRDAQAFVMRLTATQLLSAAEAAATHPSPLPHHATMQPSTQASNREGQEFQAQQSQGQGSQGQGSQGSSTSAFTADGGLAASPTRDALLGDSPLTVDSPPSHAKPACTTRGGDADSARSTAAIGDAGGSGGDARSGEAGGSHRDVTALVQHLQACRQAVALAAQHNADILARRATGSQGDGGVSLPNVWEVAYEGALECSQAAAAEEALCNYHDAASTYALAAAIMRFLAGRVGSGAQLPALEHLEPPLDLSSSQAARALHYGTAIAARLAAAAAHARADAASRPAVHHGSPPTLC